MVNIAYDNGILELLLLHSYILLLFLGFYHSSFFVVLTEIYRVPSSEINSKEKKSCNVINALILEMVNWVSLCLREKNLCVENCCQYQTYL